MSKKPTTSEILEAIEPIIKSYDISKAYVFGSVLTDQFNEKSDIDLMFERGKNFKMTFTNTAAFKKDIEKSLSRPVSIVFGEHFGKAGSKSFYNEVSRTRKEIYPYE